MKNNSKTNLFSIIILFFCILFVRSNLIAGEVLITNYQNSSPKFIDKDTGICIDIISALNKQLKSSDVQILPKTDNLTPLKRILMNITQNKIDLFVGLSRSKKREELYQYANQPLYEVTEIFAKLKEDSFEYTDNKSLAGKKIAVLRGSNTASRISNVEGVEIHELSTVQQILKFMVAGRADLAFYQNIGLEYQIKLLGMDDKVVVVKKPFKKKYHYLIFSKSVSTDTVSNIDHILKVLSDDGTLKKIMDKYIRSRDSLLNN